MWTLLSSLDHVVFIFEAHMSASEFGHCLALMRALVRLWRDKCRCVLLHYHLLTLMSFLGWLGVTHMVCLGTDECTHWSALAKVLLVDGACAVIESLHVCMIDFGTLSLLVSACLSFLEHFSWRIYSLIQFVVALCCPCSYFWLGWVQVLTWKKLWSELKDAYVSWHVLEWLSETYFVVDLGHSLDASPCEVKMGLRTFLVMHTLTLYSETSMTWCDW